MVELIPIAERIGIKNELGMAVLVPKNEAGKIGRTSDTNFFELATEQYRRKDLAT